MKEFLSSNDVLFIVVAILQLVDVFTGLEKIGTRREFDPKKLRRGLTKKGVDWIFIFIAFVASCILTRLGNALNMDFSLAGILGWGMVASVLYKETRSIVDNLTVLGVQIPTFLLKALVLSEKEFDGELKLPTDEEAMTLTLNKSLPELDGRETVTVRIRK